MFIFAVRLTNNQTDPAISGNKKNKNHVSIKNDQRLRFL